MRLVLNDPSLRILIVGDTGPNAENHLKKIKNQFEQNKLLRWLFPERVWQDTSKAPSWSQGQLYLPQDGDGSVAYHGEPTFDTIGARGAVVSRHYNIINADDLIGEDEYYSKTEMSKTIDWFTNLEALFVPPMSASLMDIPSTYWRTDDVYAYAEDFYSRGQPKIETGPFSYQRGDIAVFRRGAIEDGKPIFPEVKNEKGETVNGFPLEFFTRLREKNPERYAAQYANNPKSAENAYFRSEYLRYYEVRGEVDEGYVLYIVHAEDRVEFVRTRNLNIYSLCDPHAGGKKSASKFRGTRAAVITVGVDPRYPRIYILETWIKRAPTNAILDEIWKQNDKWKPEVFSIEANGLQKMLKYWIDERTEREPDKYSEIPYRGYIPHGAKDDESRIMGLQPLFKAGQIWMHRSQVELIEEYESFPRGLVDGLDCLAQGLEVWDTYVPTSDDSFEAIESEMRHQRSRVTGY